MQHEHEAAQASAWMRLRGWARQRGTALLLALLLEALLVLLLLTIAPSLSPKPRPIPRTFGIDLAPGSEPERPDVVETEAVAERSGGEQGEREPDPVEPPEEVVVDPPPVPPPAPSADVLWLTRPEFRQADLANAPSREPSAGPPAPAAGASGRAAGDSEVVGIAPNGEPLYAAEWHRRPTNAELSTYLPRDFRNEGWGMVACRMVEDYRVEDCQEIADYPRGSRLAGSVRQASFQFRVRPPRKGGKPLIGAWVRIRIEFTVSERP